MIYVFLGTDYNIVKKKIDDLTNSLNINNIIKYDFKKKKMKNYLKNI